MMKIGQLYIANIEAGIAKCAIGDFGALSKVLGLMAVAVGKYMDIDSYHDCNRVSSRIKNFEVQLTLLTEENEMYKQHTALQQEKEQEYYKGKSGVLTLSTDITGELILTGDYYSFIVAIETMDIPLREAFAIKTAYLEDTEGVVVVGNDDFEIVLREGTEPPTDWHEKRYIQNIQ